jgi:outer membrane lipase/esterase
MTTPNFSKIIAFGDGLSDHGRFAPLTMKRYPLSPPFLEGRFTNGPTWVELLAQKQGTALTEQNNLAMGGATTGAYNINESLREQLGLGSEVALTGLANQVDALLARTPTLSGDALYTVWAAGHDYNSYLNYGQPDVVAYPPVENLRTALSRLVSAGARTFIVGNLPDIGATPLYQDSPKQGQATQVALEFNQALKSMLELLATGQPVTFHLLDAWSIFKDVQSRPSILVLSIRWSLICLTIILISQTSII